LQDKSRVEGGGGKRGKKRKNSKSSAFSWLEEHGKIGHARGRQTMPVSVCWQKKKKKKKEPRTFQIPVSKSEKKRRVCRNDRKIKTIEREREKRKKKGARSGVMGPPQGPEKVEEEKKKKKRTSQELNLPSRKKRGDYLSEKVNRAKIWEKKEDGWRGALFGEESRPAWQEKKKKKKRKERAFFSRQSPPPSPGVARKKRRFFELPHFRDQERGGEKGSRLLGRIAQGKGGLEWFFNLKTWGGKKGKRRACYMQVSLYALAVKKSTP